MTVEEALIMLDKVLKPEGLTKVRELVLRQSWEGKTYSEIAASSGYHTDYIKLIGFQLWQLLSDTLGEKVTKNNFHSVLRRRYVMYQMGEVTNVETVNEKPDLNVKQFAKGHSNIRQDWGEAIDASFFYGRENELAKLEEWIVRDRCRVVGIFGLAGIGKTSLAVRCAEQVQGDFECIIWRSLRYAPKINSLILGLLQFFLEKPEIDLPNTTQEQILYLLDYLRKHRCLIILDNLETILSSGDLYLQTIWDSLGLKEGDIYSNVGSKVTSKDNAETHQIGAYKEDYQEYEELLSLIGEVKHQSCILLTSREKPQEIAVKELSNLWFCSLSLKGLEETAIKQIFNIKTGFSGSAEELKILIKHYGGNPLLLQIVSSAIQYLFEGQVSIFLKCSQQETLIIDEIRQLLKEQFNRLSFLEKKIMYWLAINNQPASLLQLQEEFLPQISQSNLLNALISLERRSLIEKATWQDNNCLHPMIEDYQPRFTLQPVIIDYIIDRFQKTEDLLTW